MTPIPEATRRFVELCVPLTGFTRFDLHATGMAQLYLDTARHQVGEARFDAFLNALERSRPLPPSGLGDTDREIARAVVYLWYTGAWPKLSVAAHADLRRQMANTEFIVAPSAYVEGLVWRTFNGHPAGAKPPGYATWASEPVETPSFLEIVRECGWDEEQVGEENAPVDIDLTPHLLPGPRVARDIPPSAVPVAGTPGSEGSTA